MDLELADKVAGARTIDMLEGIDGVTPVALDLVASDGPALLVQRAIDDHGRVDVLVNNVGAVRLRLDGFLGTSDEEFAWAMEMNCFAALRATRAAVTRMVGQGGGAIVNVASVNAFSSPTPGRSTTAPPRLLWSTSASRWPRSSGRAGSA